MEKKIEIQGISRMLPQSVSEDGLSRDIINLRKWNGAWRPIGSPTQFATGASEANPSYIHRVTNGSDFLISYAAGDVIVKPLLSGAYSTLSGAVGSGKDVRFSSLHNVLLVFNDTDKIIYYALYDLTELDYRWIGQEIFPDTLRILFSDSGTAEYSDALSFDSAGMSDEDIENSILGNLLKLENKYNLEGRFSGDVAFMFAYELYDGSIVKHSYPFYMTSGAWQWYIAGTTIYTRVMTRPVFYTIYTSALDLAAIQEDYRSLVKNVSIYMTRPVNPYDMDLDDLTGAYGELTRKDQLTLDKECAERNYRLVHKINIDKLAYNVATTIEFDNLTAFDGKEGLPVDNSSHHRLYANDFFKYNNRIFHSDITNTLYKGYPLTSLCTHTTSTRDPYKVWFEVDLNDIDGVKTVRSDINTFTFGSSSTGLLEFRLNENFSYPDARASVLRIYISINDVDVYKVRTITLNSATLHNYSYYIFDQSTNEERILEAELVTPESYTYSNLPTLNSIVLNPNRIQASEVDNPFYFPAKNSYNVGSSRIIGMGANTLLIESGQFGEYPLYAFTQDGVWAMNFSADASILIDSIKPATMDVCTNRDSITPTPFGVAFVSEDRLMIISGMKSAKLSTQLEGNYKSKLVYNLDYKNLLSNHNINFINDKIESVSFETFLSGALINYNYIKEELIILNPSYPYSYIYGINNKSFYKASWVYNSIISLYPKILGELGGVLYDLTDETYSSSVGIPILVESYPIKLEIDSFKKIEALALRGMFDCDQDKGAALYLFASVDGEKWFNLLGKEQVGRFKDMVTKRADFSACEFIILFSGRLKELSYLTHYDFAFKTKFKGKLR